MACGFRIVVAFCFGLRGCQKREEGKFCLVLVVLVVWFWFSWLSLLVIFEFFEGIFLGASFFSFVLVCSLLCVCEFC